MNLHSPDLERDLTRAEAEEALAALRRWASRATPEEIADLEPALARLLPGREVANYPDLRRTYPEDFAPDAAYRAGLPDLQNGPASLIRGARAAIQHVGISGFRLPIRFRRRDGGEVVLETAITGTVSLEAGKKGINMSRLMRSFYRFAGEEFSFAVMERAIEAYKADLGSCDARLQMRFRFPMLVPSLRSGLEGWQYYAVALELAEREGVRKKIFHLDYVYSSTCPCSLELAEHARQARGQLAVPHAQRSVARLSLEVLPGPRLWFEDLVEMCRRALPTETQVMVKREDEQAFGELNAAHPVFVEDAARLFAAELLADRRVGDFRVVASHQESLHSHDAVSVLVEGETFRAESLDPHLFGSLVHVP
ncbi:GTP cyclohydrolase FolE2 [Rubellimicrobium sp. CFH 75288]|uniref:GTP cyclohydrolase FolE2 n=1 Tax=Rubellimicrobium sp. CFH 75288 TaxID=2697034 RepID=UPI001411FD2B|nr:GTP cyclohydrolase FolE2 [Rubellimicrobium sp. CFH 75288]NAZ36417.1 GTP cyclohydrolase I FolE2 [Rubellimicrobium sp. CFH 75288]